MKNLIIIGVLLYVFSRKAETPATTTVTTTTPPPKKKNPVIIDEIISSQDTATYLYNYGSNYVKYNHVQGVFEKSTGVIRDAGRRMMTIDLFSWCIQNRNRNKLIFCNYRIKDITGKVLFEAYDTEGAVHVMSSQNERENNRGNNHQEQYGRFLIKEGTYTIEFTRLGGSAGTPHLWIVDMAGLNQFKCLVGAGPGQTFSTLDGIGIDVTGNYTTNFNIEFNDVDNRFIKANANGFDD